MLKQYKQVFVFWNNYRIVYLFYLYELNSSSVANAAISVARLFWRERFGEHQFWEIREGVTNG
jgi:hypothetical protein